MNFSLGQMTMTWKAPGLISMVRSSLLLSTHGVRESQEEVLKMWSMWSFQEAHGSGMIIPHLT